MKEISRTLETRRFGNVMLSKENHEHPIMFLKSILELGLSKARVRPMLLTSAIKMLPRFLATKARVLRPWLFHNP